jgi:hypothetical protein
LDGLTFEPKKYYGFDKNIPDYPVDSMKVPAEDIKESIENWLKTTKYLPSGWKEDVIPNYKFLVSIYMHLFPDDPLDV